ncbi:MAG: glycosyltransferase family 39 protein, partial [Zoogloeaceae bacterium]|nr:glycosyltransferase family 39 protein [Zoogloeaceae bacterium]
MWNAATPDALTVPPGNARIDFPIVLLSFALFLSFFTTAWVAEDAYITFRVVDNALNGHGLVWNPGERVQVYTHPLWFFLLLAGSSLYDNPYVACLVISALCVVATFWLALKTLRPCGVLSFLVLFLLFFSRAFVDYMTSGLENPLVYLFVALFLWVYLEREKHRHCLFFLTLIAAAMYLSRPDSIVLIFPALLHVFLADEKPWPRKIALLLLGGLPALAWVLFSLVYYGAPVPNTALAKVMTGISTAEYLAQAVQYTLHTLQTDTVTVVLLLAGCLVGFWQSSWRLKALSLGIFLWFAYLAAVGADYMAGRFFSIPVLFAVLTLARALRDRPFGKPGVVLLVALALALPQARFTLFSPVAYNSREISPFGVADERGYYYPGTGLRPALKRSGEVTAQHFWVSLGGALKDAMIPGGGVYVACQIGMLPYTAGADFHWVDALALSDAFLARLPARSGNRVGHYERALPPGYLESVLTKQNRVADPALARLYDDVALATTGDIFRWERLAAIFRLNTGFHRNAAANFDREAVGLPGLPV